MLNAKFKTRASRAREMRENLSIIMASQKCRLPPPPSATTSTTSQYAIRAGKVTISNVPKLAECRGPQTSVRVRSGWHSMPCSSQPIVRVSNQNQSTASTSYSTSGRLPFTPFLCRQVQGPDPPSTSKPGGAFVPSTPQSTPKPNGVILQSPWVERGQDSTVYAKTTSQYTIKQLVDILCGDAEAIPEALEPIGKRIQFRSDNNMENNQAIALGKSFKTPKRLKTGNGKGLVPLFDDFASASVLPKKRTYINGRTRLIRNKLLDSPEPGFGFMNLDLSVGDNMTKSVILPPPVPVIDEDIFKCPQSVGIGMQDQRRKFRKVSFNDAVEINPNLFPVTPLHDTTNTQHNSQFNPIWEQGLDKSMQQKIHGCPLVLTPPKSLQLFPVDHDYDEDDKSIADGIDLSFEQQYFSPSRFTKQGFGKEDISPLSFYRRTGAGTGNENPMQISTETETTSSWFHNVPQSPINRGNISQPNSGMSLPSLFSKTTPLSSPSRTFNYGHGLEFIREMYHNDECQSQPFSLSW